MKKFKIFVDFEEEEKYLNEMAKQGHLLKKYSSLGIYHFVDGEKQDLKYRVDYRTFKNKKEFEQYKALFEDFGWEHVYGKLTSANQYFLPKKNNADDDIFSSKESGAARYKKLCQMCSISMLMAIIDFVCIVASNGFKLSSFGFLTPGLWEKTGGELIGAVLFELPFVIFRVGVLAMLVAMAIIYGSWASRAKKTYEEKIQG